MSLFFVTGSAGTGKSTLCKALKEEGYVAYDTDIDRLARWTNLETGYVHPKSSVKAADRTPEFLKAHGWHVPRPQIEQLHTEADGKLGFLCGVLDNLDELHDLFDGVIALYVDDETIRHRLATRTDNDWGKQPHELQQTLDNHHSSYDRYRAMGAVIIDSTQSVKQVAEDVLAAASELAQD
jgi:dephospho-CoA kinase